MHATVQRRLPQPPSPCAESRTRTRACASCAPLSWASTNCAGASGCRRDPSVACARSRKRAAALRWCYSAAPRRKVDAGPNVDVSGGGAKGTFQRFMVVHWPGGAATHGNGTAREPSDTFQTSAAVGAAHLSRSHLARSRPSPSPRQGRPVCAAQRQPAWALGLAREWPAVPADEANLALGVRRSGLV